MKNNFMAGLLIGTNLLLAAFLIMGAASNKSENSNPKLTSTETPAGVEPFVGEIALFAGNFAPRGWAFCDGQLLPIAQNQALFSILGTTYGGDGRTTFALPDLRGRVPVHLGTGPGLSTYDLGQNGGTETVTLTVSNLPSHNHSIPANGKAPTTVDPNDAVMAKLAKVAPIYAKDGGSIAMKPTGNTGGNQPLDIRQPYLTINYIIALQGIFPPRD